MAGNGFQGKAFDPEVFERTNRLITDATRRLPEKAVRALAREVVLRLTERRETAGQPPATPESTIEALCEALVSADAEAATEMVLGLHRDGVSPDVLYLGYIAGAARRLGDLWEADLLSFYDVTLATGRIFALLRSMRVLFVPVLPYTGRRAVFATVPGEDHAIGITIAADMFRREGWEIDLLVGFDHEAILRAVGRSNAVIVAVSAGSRRSLLALARLVVALHVVHPPALVMVCGHLVLDEPEFMAHLGAESLARDVPEALAEMERLHALIAGRAPGNPS